MSPSKSILFVCTGNVFRSVSAEQCFKKYLSDNGVTDWNVGSAGTVATPEPMDPKTCETLGELGMDNIEHTQRKLTKEMLDEYDVIVGMAEDHIEFMKSEFNYKYGILFNDLASHETVSIDDVPKGMTSREAIEEHIARAVTHIHDATPELFKNASDRFYLFSDFVEGRKTHRNGFPFMTLDETPHSIAFMSLDIPSKEDGHILVIPKKRYRDLSEIPDEVLGHMLSSIKKLGGVLSVDHGGYNVLLNNGLDAGQYIIHTHFHIIPRRSGDGIQIETWKRPKISIEDFIELNEKLKARMALM